ncbi:AdoMet_MTases domain containing protein [Burkholderiaceae bacterium]
MVNDGKKEAEQVISNAYELKPDFSGLKTRWDEMLSKFFLDKNTLNPIFTTQVSCPFCSASEIDSSFNLNGFWHKSCKNCKTLYVSPRLNNACIEELYKDEYYSEMYTRSMLPVFERRKLLIGNSKFNQTVKWWGGEGVGRVLDIGAGIGEVTDVFRENGWKSHAIEMNKVAIEWLNTRGHKEVFHGMLSDYRTKNSFDIIMAWGVVEHVLDPDIFLKRVFDLLKPGGIFVSEVPHGECLLVDVVKKTGLDPKRILMGEQHIVLYSTQAYISLHERNGFKKVHLQSNGLDFSTIKNEVNILADDLISSAIQDSIDHRMYGDLLRGFWRR